jgi:hypothetical protein
MTLKTTGKDGSFRLTVEGADEVRAELARMASLPARALAALAVDIEDKAEEAAARHSKSGALIRSIERKRDGADWVIGHDGQHAPHALFVHWGTKPHKILPKKKKALRWSAGTFFKFATGVNHPGYKGDPYFARAAREAPALFEKHVAAMLAKQGR